MGRPLRLEYKGALYHVTSRGNERKAIFRSDADRRKFLDLLSDYHDRFDILVHCYVLMDNHYHLILETPQGNLLKVMHGINAAYTGYFNRTHNRIGHLFQGRYKAILVDKDSYLLPLSRYVHLNPVKARITDKLETYTWSSYPSYISKKKEQPWIEYAWILKKFSENTATAHRRYRAYVNEGMNKILDDLFSEVDETVILGRETFKEKIKLLIDRTKISREIVGRKRLTHAVEAEAIIKQTAKTFQTKEEAVTARNNKNNTARKIALYLIGRYSGIGNAEAGKLFGGIHYSAVSKTISRFQKELSRDTRLNKLVEEIKSNVKT